jgi:hypothetical protein
LIRSIHQDHHLDKINHSIIESRLLDHITLSSRSSSPMIFIIKKENIKISSSLIVTFRRLSRNRNLSKEKAVVLIHLASIKMKISILIKEIVDMIGH